MPWSHSSPVMEALFPCLGSILPLPWNYPSPALEPFFPCLGTTLPLPWSHSSLQYTKILWISAGILNGFPEKPKRRRSKRPIALVVFRSLVCGLSPEWSDANLPLRTTIQMGFAVFQNGGIVSSLVLRTFRFAPSPPRATLAGTRLRPRVARVLRTTPLTTHA